MRRKNRMTILYFIVVLFVFTYIMTIIQIMKENFDSLLIKLFCYNTAALKELHNYENRVRKQIKTIVVMSMGLNLTILIIFICYQFSNYLYAPVIFFLVPLNQLITSIIVNLIVKHVEKINRTNE